MITVKKISLGIFVFTIICIWGCEKGNMDESKNIYESDLFNHNKFDIKIYQQLKNDSIFLQFCQEYNNNIRSVHNLEDSHEQIIHLIKKIKDYENSLSHYNNLMIYIFHNYFEKYRATSKTILDPVIVEGESMLVHYKEIVPEVNSIIESYKNRSGFDIETLIHYQRHDITIGSEFKLLDLIRRKDLYASINELTEILRYSSLPGEFENYIHRYPLFLIAACEYGLSHLSELSFYKCPYCNFSISKDEGTIGGSGGDGGGGSSTSITTPWIDSFYADNSTLDKEQKRLLNKAFQRFIEKSPVYEKMYNQLINSKIKIIFEIDPQTLKKTNAFAGFINGKMLFYNNQSIKFNYLQEEVIHVIQAYDVYNESYMRISRKNMEFEAKVVQDIVMVQLEEGGAYIGSFGISDDFRDEYISWILSFNTTDIDSFINRFHEFCLPWTGYTGSYDPGFVPKIIETYF